MTGMHHGTRYWLKWDLTNFLPGLALNFDPLYFSLLIAEIIGVSHQLQASYFQFFMGE
jgi:hypothetical protein